MPTLTSISPIAGPPGTAITLTGTGFSTGSQAACPVLVPTTYLSATTLSAEIPGDLVGAAGTSLAVGVYVRNEDGTASAAVTFTVLFPAEKLQSWTTVDKVVKAVPGFKRGGQIGDDDIQEWIAETAQEVAAAMVKRELPIDPAAWPACDAAAFPTPQGLLEMINRAGAAACLAAAIASNFSAASPWAVQTGLQKQYDRQLAALKAGDYDKLFRPGAATVESGPLLAAGDTSLADGTPSAVFTKDQVF
jgi:hypothetical protein